MRWRGGACRSLLRMVTAPTARKCEGNFSSAQRRYLDFHRENAFLEVRLVR